MTVYDNTLAQSVGTVGSSTCSAGTLSLTAAASHASSGSADSLTILETPPPTSQPWLYGIVDQQHLILILGAGTNTPLLVRSVHVWQSGTTNNIHDFVPLLIAFRRRKAANDNEPRRRMAA
jgi:poly(3-hydroxyalkanoate) synthetase